MGELASRFATIIVVGGLGILTVLYSTWSMMMFYLAFYLGIAWEYNGLVQSDVHGSISAILVTVLPVIWHYSPFDDFEGIIHLMSLIVLLPAFILSPLGFLKAAVGVVWIFPALWCCISLSLSDGPLQVIIVMTIIWLTDGMAYLVGKAIGRTKLAPTVSPNKTIEGTVFGIILSIGLTYIISLWYFEIKRHDLLMLALLTGVTGSIGDLLESFFKRKLGVKDSGTLMGFHGGGLDRTDSVLIAMPFAYVYLYFAPFQYII